MMFNWLRRKPDPQLEAMKEKVARGDRTIEEAERVLQEAIKHTDKAVVRLERRTEAVRRRIDSIPIEQSVDSIGRDIGRSIW